MFIVQNAAGFQLVMYELQETLLQDMKEVKL